MPPAAEPSSAPADPTSRSGPGATALRWLPALLITALGLAILWPIPAGEMPLSADHTVHLTRTWMWAQELSSGHVRGWSSVWFFGTPVGELYPILGDLLIIAVRVATFGLVDWPAAYALGFTVVFLAQGWVLLRAGRVLGWGPLPGLVAATLALVDVGAYREGGYIYTVFYGVWPQALATSLTWLGLAELTRIPHETSPARVRRRIGTAALAMTAALLAHPMSMAVLAITGPLVVFTAGASSVRDLQRNTVRGVLAGGLAVVAAAWWIVPMLSHRAWMASYGWLWQPLDVLVPRLLEGHWAQSMPAAAGYCVSGGFLVVALVGNRAARALAITTLALWIMSSSDVPWQLRLDLVSEGFTHLQYQRFLTAAKPGLFLMAGALVGAVAHLGVQLWRRGRPLPRSLAAACALLVLGSGGWIASEQKAQLDENPVPGVQRTRIAKYPQLDADYRDLLAWMSERWQDRDRDYRFVVYDQRNIHWFMDAPVFTGGAPIFKLGFTPGDNFVHKPERGPVDLLDRAQVRYEIRRGQRRRRNTVARFGQLHVVERASWPGTAVARLHGAGSLEVLEDDVDRGRVRVKVSDSDADTELLFGVAGYPRWSLVGPRGPVQWHEAPATGFGPGATLRDRQEGRFRGGKAHGDDGSEPTLVAAPARDGEYVLEYTRWRPADVAAAVASLLALVALGLLVFDPLRGRGVLARVDAGLRALAAVGHPVVWVAAALAVVVSMRVAVARGRAEEAPTAVGWALDGRASVLRHARAGYFKTDMLIRPALIFDRRHREPAVAVFEGVSVGDALQGWMALEDDDAKQTKQGQARVRVQARPPGDGQWSTLLDRTLRHAPGMQPLDLPLADLAGQSLDVRVVVDVQGKRPPRVGIALDLESER